MKTICNGNEFHLLNVIYELRVKVVTALRYARLLNWLEVMGSIPSMFFFPKEYALINPFILIIIECD